MTASHIQPTSSPHSSHAQPTLGQTIDVPEAWDGDEAELLTRLVGYYEDSETSSVDERGMAELHRDYYDTRQHTPEEMAILRRRRQPPSTNNYVKRKVDLLLGLERRGRSDPKAFPRTPHEENRADIATQTLRYISDDTRFDVIRSSVFDNILIEGMGGAEVIVEEDEVSGGYNVVVNHIPWDRLFRDPHSAHPAFTDARYLGVVIWMDREEAIDLYPGCEDTLATTFDGARSDTFDDRPRTHWSDNKRRRVRVVQIYWKRRKDWWMATFTKGGFMEAPRKSPYTDRHGHATCPLILRSCYIDRDLNRYGIVRDMVSPQDAINKRESKLLHLLNVNQIHAQEGAFEDIDKARNEAAKPDGVLIYRPGAEFKIDRHQGEIAGHFQMLQHSVQQMNVTGPNAAMAGKDPREQSGRAIIAQQSGGQMEHEPIADTLRQWSHKVYEAMWMRARQFWTEQKAIRVTDEDKKVQFVMLNRPITLMEELQGLQPEEAQRIARQMGLGPGDPRLQQVIRTENSLDDLDVDITVEEGPDSPTMAAEQFAQIMQLPPQLLLQFPPQLIIQASSLRNKDALLKMLDEHQKAQAQNQQGAQAMQKAALDKTTAEAADKKASALVKMHGIQQDHAAMPWEEAMRAAEHADQQAQTVDRYHGMELASAAQPAQSADAQAQTLQRYHDMATGHAAATAPPEPEEEPNS